MSNVLLVTLILKAVIHFCFAFFSFMSKNINIFRFPSLEPSVGPDSVSLAELNGTTYNISWAPLIREKSYGKVISYSVKEELLLRGTRQKRSISTRAVNTTTTFVVLYDLARCSQYHVSVRAYTNAGPGPYSQPMVLETSSEYMYDISSKQRVIKANKRTNIKKKFLSCFKVLEYGIHYRSTSKMLRPLVYSSV